MSTKVLSIIIPMYNMENYIGKCLQSLLDIPTECLESIDIIVVNDGSKDQSLRIATSYQKKYPEVIRVIDKENGNYGSCINAGLAKALGTYVKVLDSDDYFSSVGLSAILEKISSIPVMDMIITDFDIINANDEITNHVSFQLKKEKCLLFNDIWKKISDIQMHAIIYRTELFKEINYHQTEGISYTDQEWCYYPMVKIQTVYYVNNVLYKYLLGREGQTMSENILKKKISNLEIVANKMLKHFSLLDKNKLSRERYLLLRKRILVRYKDIYRLYLIGFKKEEFDAKAFDELDSFVKQNKDIYSLLGLTCVYKKVMPIPYVLLYRLFHLRIIS
jgi:glycosyltransferase involved in cell wall biosynthesis